MRKYLPKIIVIVGPTASGKTALAVRLAEEIGGEIVSADSRLSYKGMDIGTAKPTMKERSGITHHLIDILPPSKTLTLSEYKRRAVRAIRGILKRGRVPIVVGGTGLYVQAIVENFDIPEVPPDPAFRARLQKWTVDRICDRLEKLDPEYARRIGRNPRYAIRALEVIRATGKPFSAQQGKGERLFDALLLGVNPGKEALDRRIRLRVRQMVRAGLIEEVRRLRRRYGSAFKPTAFHTAIGYRELLPVLDGTKSLADGLRDIERSTRLYAKRQMTWWRRMPDIEWTPSPMAALKRAKIWLRSAK